ncbi:6-phosphogluconate dehydrogenase protein [Rhizobium phage RHph_N65]|nr:6-phosphogluconate dehydrogenase protein [Rhizobium phage RHph_N65]
MGTIWIKEFTGGLDTRRMAETTAGGVLMKANNGHISRGGEFEKRAAFVPEFTLPAGTVGMAAGATGIYVFGSGATPAGLPAGVSYQRLQHSDGVTALTEILSYDLYASKIYAVGRFADGTIFHFYDGVRITSWYDGRARASFQVTGGVGTSTLTALTVNGVSIIGGTITWTTSNENTAALIAASINSTVSVPDYTATAVGAQVNILAATAGAAPNGFAVGYTVAGGFTITPASGFLLANGADSPTGTYQPGSFVKTVSKKEYSTSGSVLHFSGINAPTKWTTDNVGAGFIDMASETSGAEQLTAIGKYQSNIAVFAERTIIIEYIDPDPTLNRQVQVLNNTGTQSPKSVTQFGDADLFYLDNSGLRSLKARDSSNAAATTDIGVPVDTLVIDQIASLTTDELANVIGLIEPVGSRFWLVMKNLIFVFSFFNGAKVSAWSTYVPSTVQNGVDVPFDVTAAVVFRRKVYIRSGDTIYVYGGLPAGFEYDATVAEAWLPYLDANVPTRKKNFTGIDAALEGEWSVHVAMDPTNAIAEDKVATVYETTFGDGRLPGIGDATHLSLRFRSTGDGPAKVSSAVIHYEGKIDED